jgi:hypothetical protein
LETWWLLRRFLSLLKVTSPTLHGYNQLYFRSTWSASDHCSLGIALGVFCVHICPQNMLGMCLWMEKLGKLGVVQPFLWMDPKMWRLESESLVATATIPTLLVLVQVGGWIIIWGNLGLPPYPDSLQRTKDPSVVTFTSSFILFAKFLFLK